jgi:predicted ATP-grasp superfamily ATP-dependent carboligase
MRLVEAPSRRGAATARPAIARVLVLATAFRSGPWAVRSLARAGYHVIGAHEEGPLAGGRSLACMRPLRYPSPVHDPGAFVKAVREICRREAIAVVLPAAEDTARVLAERQPDLGGAVVVGPDRETYAALCDKWRLVRSSARAGVDHPHTIVVGPEGPRGPWPPLPAIVKPRISGEDLGHASAAVSVATPEERADAIAGLRAAGLEAIVQERVEGQRWTCQSVRDADGRLDFTASRVDRDYPRGAGVASVMHTVPDHPAALRESVAALLGLVDYRGPSTIGFIEREGRCYVHDVNLRLGSSVGLVIASGLDMPRRSVEVALGLPAPAQPPLRSTYYVRLDGEVNALARALTGRRIGEPASAVAGRLLRAIARRDGMVDPQPLDPFWTGRLAGVKALCLARRVRSELRRPARG